MVTGRRIQRQARRREIAAADRRRRDENAGLAYQFTHTVWTYPRTRAH